MAVFLIQDGIFIFFEIMAKMGDGAFQTFWFSGQTNVPAMQNQPVMGHMDMFFGNVFDQLLFNFQWGFGILCNQSQSF